MKNVFASETTLAKMYDDHAEDYFSLKRELDPACVLRNDFLDRTFSDLLTREYASDPRPATGHMTFRERD